MGTSHTYNELTGRLIPNNGNEWEVRLKWFP
jgi:hypothetical protein